MFRISTGINLIVDKLPSAIGLQLVYYPPNLQLYSNTKRLIMKAKEINPRRSIEVYLRTIIVKWMSYLKDIKMVVSVKCPFCRKLLDIENGLDCDQSFLQCDNIDCSQTWSSSYQLQYWLANIQGIAINYCRVC